MGMLEQRYDMSTCSSNRKNSFSESAGSAVSHLHSSLVFGAISSLAFLQSSLVFVAIRSSALSQCSIRSEGTLRGS